MTEREERGTGTTIQNLKPDKQHSTGIFNLFESVVRCGMCLHSKEASSMMKGFKVSDETLSQRKGIACKNLQELKDKIHQKFSYKNDGDSSGNYKIYTEDGTEIDDDEYLMNLPSNTLLIVSRY